MIRTATSVVALATAWRSQPLPSLPELVPEDLLEPCDCADIRFPLLDWREGLARIPTQCYYCDGTGRCMHDYPRKGTGKDYNGEPEYFCSGTGKCQPCGGSGWLIRRYRVRQERVLH